MREFMNITKALADETRVRILLALRKGELCVCQITELLGLAASTASEHLAKHIGYSADELAALPEGANMGLSCGNPNALAALQPGDVVLDLGAGGGFDVLIAARKGLERPADMASAVKTAASVKDSPHQTNLRLADKLTGGSLSQPATGSDPCCGAAESRSQSP